MQVGSPRPTIVTLLAILVITLGVLSIITGLVGSGLGGLVVVAYSGLAGTILLTLGTLVLAFGVLEIAYGVGFLEGRGWSWTLGIVVALVSLVSSIVVIGLPAIAGSTDAIVLTVLNIIRSTAIIPIITSSLTIYILTRPHVKIFFGKGAKQKQPLPETEQ